MIYFFLELGKLDKVRETIWSVNRKVFEANPVILEQALIFKSNRNEKEKFERWSEIKEFLQKVLHQLIKESFDWLNLMFFRILGKSIKII